MNPTAFRAAVSMLLLVLLSACASRPVVRAPGLSAEAVIAALEDRAAWARLGL